MAMSQEKKPLVFTAQYSTITEVQHEDDDVASKSGCFGLCGLGSGTESRVASQFKKVKEFSEIVAGPKWKNLIRKIGKLCNPRKSGNKQTNMQFNYSPESYGLNFAGDNDQDHEEDDEKLLHSFSARFASHAFANINNVHDQQRSTRAGL